MNNKLLTPVEWQNLAKEVWVAEFGNDQEWPFVEFKARCESFMPSHTRNDPLIWLQKTSQKYPHVKF